LKTPAKFILCYVTDQQSVAIPPERNREASLLQSIETAAHAGVHWIQIREKDLSASRLLDLTRAAIRVADRAVAESPTRVLVNDRYDVAWAASAHGVHAAETSVPIHVLVTAARAAGRRHFLVGASCHSQQRAIEAAKEGADYLFFGPVFATPSKEAFGAPQGLRKLAEVCAAVSIPVIAIGGITLENARACQQAGAAGIAAIRLFRHARDSTAVITALLKAVSRDRPLS
jgi:thiamine-phosphate pyrophosphorylase